MCGRGVVWCVRFDVLSVTYLMLFGQLSQLNWTIFGKGSTFGVLQALLGLVSTCS